MAYPEKGATYKNKPAWLDEVKRAEGGQVDAPLSDHQKEMMQQMGNAQAQGLNQPGKD